MNMIIKTHKKCKKYKIGLRTIAEQTAVCKSGLPTNYLLYFEFLQNN